MEELRKEILKLCNSSELPLEAIYYVLKDIYRDACDTYDNYLLKLEKEKFENSKKEENIKEEEK